MTKTRILLLLSTLLALCAFAQNNPVPQISQPLVPFTATPGGAAFTLTLNGAGFVSGSSVHWNGAARTTTFVSSSQLKASVTAADIATASTASVTVVNPAAGGGTSSAALFDVTFSSTGPVYSGVYIGYQGNSTAADVNGDGNLDLVSFYSTALTSYLGNGDGTFTAAGGATIGSTGAYITTGDFNRDGKVDVAIANTNGTVSVLLGNGDGSFQGHVDYPTGATSTGVAVGDVNGDGNPDLVVANNSPAGGVAVLLGQGNGFFQTPVIYAAGAYPWAVALGDMNGDGKLDIVTAANAAAVVLLGNGDGTFQRSMVFEMSNNSQGYALALADLDGDGLQDAAISGADGALYVMLGKGGGALKQPRSFVASLSHPHSLVIGDFNGDTLLDIAVGDTVNGEIALLTGKGGGLFNPRKFFFAPSGTAWLSAGDFNNDGALDWGASASVLMQTVAKLSKSKLKFGTVPIGKSSVVQTVTLTNYRNATLNISSITISDNFIQTNTCGTSVPAVGTCTISVSFVPTVEGSITGDLTISDDTFGPQIVTLSGTGAPGIQPGVTLNPTSLTFGAQKIHTTSLPQNITVTNSGKATLDITSIVASGDFAQTSTCGTTLRVGQTCTIIVTFTPTQTGTRAGSITLTDNAPDSPQTVPLTGTGTN